MVSDGFLPERPALAVRCAVLGASPRGLEVLLVEGGGSPRTWSLPGAPLRIEEPLERAARACLESSTGLCPDQLEQLYTFGDPGPDPRQRVVTVAYLGLARLSDPSVRLTTEAKGARWMPAREAPPLPDGQGAVVEKAAARLRAKLRHEPVAFELLPEKFTLTELQQLYERALEAPLDKRNFRKRALASDLVVPLDEFERAVAHRAARLYRFDRGRFEQLEKSGLHFEL